MNFKELSKKIKEIGISHVGHEDYDNSELKLKCVYSVGGIKGGGEYVERVFEHVTNNGEIVYARITGYYASHRGTDWNNNVDEVRPVLKTITVYENAD